MEEDQEILALQEKIKQIRQSKKQKAETKPKVEVSDVETAIGGLIDASVEQFGADAVLTVTDMVKNAAAKAKRKVRTKEQTKE